MRGLLDSFNVARFDEVDVGIDSVRDKDGNLLDCVDHLVIDDVVVIVLKGFLSSVWFGNLVL